MTENKMEKLQTQGVLVSLSAGNWQARTKIDVRKLGKDIPKEIINASRSLIDDRNVLKPFKQVVNTSYKFIVFNSSPFPLKGLHWVKKENIPKVDEFLKEQQREHNKCRDKLAKDIEKHRRRYAKKYPEYYDPKNYPTGEEIKRKCYFEWKFVRIDTPDAKILPAAMFKREQQKFQNMVKEMEEMTINLFGNMIIERLSKLHEQSESGKANQGTINSINKLLKNWEDIWSDHVDNRKFRMAVTRIKRQLDKTTAERIRSNDDFRKKVGEEAGKAINKIQATPNFHMGRKLDL